MAADDAMDDIDIEDNLWRAASDGDMALVSSLLREEDGGVNAKDEYGLTPLMAGAFDLCKSTEAQPDVLTCARVALKRSHTGTRSWQSGFWIAEPT